MTIFFPYGHFMEAPDEWVMEAAGSTPGLTLKMVYDEASKDLAVDNGLCQRIARYKAGFINKNDDHIEFFGGNLLGVQTVRHTPEDRMVFFEDVLGMSEQDLRTEILKTDLVEADFKRVSDPYNSAALYLLYRLKHSTKISAKLREQAMIDVVFMLQTKLLTSILSHWFEHPASLDEAKATYAALSFRFGLKEAGSWTVYITNRAMDFLDPVKGIHRIVIDSFAPDKAILYAITEPQDRLREVVKGIYQVFMDVRRNGSRIRTTTSTLELDGEITVRSREINNKLYLDYALNAVQDKTTFIRDEVLRVVIDALPTVSERLLIDLLGYVSDNYSKVRNLPMDEMIKELILHAIGYVQENRLVLRKTDDLGTLVIRLKSLYQAPRMKDMGLIKARDLADKVVERSRVSKSNAQKSALRTCLELYVVLRALTMNYYK